MCRLLLVQSRIPFEMRRYLEAFSSNCQSSREYQGDGWGVYHRLADRGALDRDTTPIWSADFSSYDRAHLMLVHARSAFRDAPPTLAHTMPFTSGSLAFAFNGELHRVRLRTPGDNGAQKIFGLSARLMRRDPDRGFHRAVDAITARSSHVRAMNIVMTDSDRVYCCTTYSQESDYFSLHLKRTDGFIAICSKPLFEEPGWETIPNNTVEAWPCY